MLSFSLHILFFLSVPVILRVLEERTAWVKRISPVVLCYGAGLLAGNLPGLPLDADLALTVSGLSLALAIPLLLFSVDLVGWFRLARTTVISFGLCILSVLVVTALARPLFASQLPEMGKISGMMVGVYTGGTPNMAAIGTALDVVPETFVMLNAADMFCGMLYFFFLITLAGRWFGRLLPTAEVAVPDESEAEEEETSDVPSLPKRLPAVGLALLIAACGFGARLLVPESLRDPVFLLVVSSVGVTASLSSRIRSLPGAYRSGMDLLLVFCVAIGSAGNIGKLLAASPTILGYVAVVLFGSILLHLGLCLLLRVDRDTMIITSTAAVFGPAFIGPIAEVLKNRELIVSGLATGLVGYAVGNYLGLGTAWLLG